MEIVFYIIISSILLYIPIVGKYLSIINTLFHEAGHAIVAKLTFGKIEKIELFSNTEGLAWTSSPFWIGRVFTSFAGYPAASATSFLFLYFISKHEYFYLFIILCFVIVFSLIFWIRNIYGVLWAISSLGLIYYLITNGNEEIIKAVLLMITTILFFESLKSAFIILKLSFKQPMDAGDATSLWKSILFIPPQVWGIVFFLQALVFSCMGLQLSFN